MTVAPHDRRERRADFRGIEFGDSVPAHKGHPGGCKVCEHVERTRIELLLAGGAGQTAVAKKFGMSKDSVHRHWRGHVSEERRLNLIMGPVGRMELSARVCEESSSVIDHLKIARAGIYQQYHAALGAGDRNGGALLVGRLHENLRITAQITGELLSSPLVQINNSQTNVTALLDSREFAAFQATLIRVLGHFPEARDAVVAEFERLERLATPVPRPAPITVPALEHAPETAGAT
jgi:hypothetical protein